MAADGFRGTDNKETTQTRTPLAVGVLVCPRALPVALHSALVELLLLVDTERFPGCFDAKDFF